MRQDNSFWGDLDWAEIGRATTDTLTMTAVSSLFTVVIGLMLGVVLCLTASGGLLRNRLLYAVLAAVVNVLRSVPFIILMVLLIPFTRSIVGTSIGVKGVIPPLIIGAAPFFARLVETSLREVDRGVIEAAQAMGASKWQIVRRVLLREARPGLLASATITVVTIVSYTAMSGPIGGGGLGDLAIRYGYQRFQPNVMLVTVVLLIAIVHVLQLLGDRLVRHFGRK